MVNKVVARYRSGRVVRGTSSDFRPNREDFTITESLPDGSSRSVRIVVEELKAVFFVKTLEGNSDYSERKLQIPDKGMGRALVVTFEDGEVLRGTTLGTELLRNGFLLFPADPRSNNKRVFVIRSAVKEIREEAG